MILIKGRGALKVVEGFSDLKRNIGGYRLFLCGF